MTRFVFLLPLVLLACDKKDEGPTPTQRDQEALRAIVRADAELDRALTDADHLSAAHKESEAADLLETKALPLAQRALDAANAAVVTTPWGSGLRNEWIAVINDRKDEIPRYAAALRTADMVAELQAVTRQLDIQRRVIRAAAEVEVGPENK